jgi:hypothetical protein
MATNNITVEPFKASGDRCTISIGWAEWIADFNIFLSAAGITDDQRKRECLLYY